MTGVQDRVKQGFSEIRTVTLGVQILLGFQYQIVFQPAFPKLPGPAAAMEPFALLLLALAIVLLVAPGAFHQIAERGADSHRQDEINGWSIGLALACLSLAIGLDGGIALSREFGLVPAVVMGAVATAFTFLSLFGVAAFRPRRPRPRPKESRMPSLKERVTVLLTESRIVLPGVQALLGFQLAAYLTDAFGRLPPEAQFAHAAGLGLLFIAILLLMAPAAFHRLAERGENTARMERVSRTLVVAAMAPLGAALATDVYVVCRAAPGFEPWAAPLAGCVCLVWLPAWYVAPWLVRRRLTADARR